MNEDNNMKKGSDRASGAPRDDKQPGIVVLCVLTCVLAVAGCSLAPPHQAPPLPVASAYPADTRESSGLASAGLLAPEIAWRDYFADPQLKALIAQALAHNRD